jgi:hypothetical protein
MNQNIFIIMLLCLFLLLFILKQITNYNKFVHNKSHNALHPPSHKMINIVSNKFIKEIIEPFHKH